MGMLIRRATSIRLIVALMFQLELIALSACGPTKVTTESYPALHQHHVRRVVVMPFQRLTTPQILEPSAPEINAPSGAKRSDISLEIAPRVAERFANIAATMPPTVPQRVAEALYEKLKDWTALIVLGPDEAEGVIAGFDEFARDWPYERVVRQVMDKLQADAALLGKVLVYRERIGSRWGADPAAVGFEVRLIAPDGNLLWTGNYYEKQGAMNEDLVGFFQHGGGFVTADQLIDYGTDKIARELPYGGR